MAIDFSTDQNDGRVIYGLDDLMSRYDTLLFTVPGSFSADPDFGIGINQFVSEPINRETSRAIQTYIINKTRQYFGKSIVITRLDISQSNNHTISIIMEVYVSPFGATKLIEKEI